MKAGVYYSASDLRVEDVPDPTVGASDILVKVMASGICGSDLMEWYRIKKAPLVLGHEIAGEVVQVGKDVENVKLGDRVFATHHVPCAVCHACLKGHETACSTLQTVNNFMPGGFAEYVRVSGRSVLAGTLVLPEEVSYEQGSFVEPLGTVVRGLRSIELVPGDSVVIVGAGMAGLLYVKLGRALGAGRIVAIDTDDARLDAAQSFGADHTFRAGPGIASEIRELNAGRLADKVIVCAGALQASEAALGYVDKGGTVLFYAVPRPGETIAVDFNPFWRDDVSFKTCYGAAPVDTVQALELIRRRAVTVDDMITHRYPLAEIAEAFKTAAGRGAPSLKVIVEPHPPH